jgi:DNA-binding NarL/FixJ family response regulator
MSLAPASVGSISVVIADDHPITREGLALVLRREPEISAITGISESTVKTHVASIIEKLGVKSRTEAALIAEKRGFLRD